MREFVREWEEGLFGGEEGGDVPDGDEAECVGV